MWEMPRDVSIVMMVHKYDRVMIEPIQRAFFPGKRYISCYLRVAELIRNGYLSAQQLHPTTPRGSGKLLLGLGPQGKRLVAQQLKKPVNTLPRLLPFRSGDKGLHHSAICHFRLGLEADRDTGIATRIGQGSEPAGQGRVLREGAGGLDQGPVARDAVLDPDVGLPEPITDTTLERC
jgi:hypothetical protein